MTESELSRLIKRLARDDTGYISYKDLMDLLECSEDGEDIRGEKRERGNARGDGKKGKDRERDRDREERTGGRADRAGRDRDMDRNRDRGDRDMSRGSRGDDDMDDRDKGSERVSAMVLKANESRVLFKKRPDLLQELLLQMRTVRKERGYVINFKISTDFLSSLFCIQFLTLLP